MSTIRLLQVPNPHRPLSRSISDKEKLRRYSDTAQYHTINYALTNVNCYRKVLKTKIITEVRNRSFSVCKVVTELPNQKTAHRREREKTESEEKRTVPWIRKLAVDSSTRRTELDSRSVHVGLRKKTGFSYRYHSTSALYTYFIYHRPYVILGRRQHR